MINITSLEQARLSSLFSRSYIIGGSPCSGKSTIAERLAEQFQFHYFKADDHVSDYGRLCTQVDQPYMYQFSKLSWNEIWSKPVEVQVNDEIHFYHEMFSFILDDLAYISGDQKNILEGAAFLPELLDAWSVECKRAVFMVPTPEFQIQNYRNRPWIHSILNACDDQDFAFMQWMKRDELFGREVTRQACERGYQLIKVDGSISLDDQYQQIVRSFGLDELKTKV